MSATYQPLPYVHSTGTIYKTLIVEPNTSAEDLGDGLIAPDDINNLCARGVVLYTCEGSSFKKGDNILYKRTQQDTGSYRSIEIYGVEHPVVFEDEVWRVNGEPYNRLFVEIVTQSHVTKDGLVIADDTEGTPRKAIIYKAPAGSYFKSGAIIEFRKEVKVAIYPSFREGDKTYHILYEKDVFTVNGLVSPHRIIVSIDLAAQKIKRETTDSGFVQSPLYIHMLRNLQYGEVVDIGSEAQKMYPLLNVGDMAILHHSIESQPYRILRRFEGSFDNYIEEHRIINCLDPNAREIFGKIENRKLYGKILDMKIIPFNKSVFLNFEFDIFEHSNRQNDELLSPGLDSDLSKCRDLSSFTITLDHKKKDRVQKFQAKYEGYRADVERIDKSDPEFALKVQDFENKMERLKADAIAESAGLNRNHLMRCKIEFPKQLPNICLASYKELYPINLFGKKYLIAHSDFITAKINEMNQVKPLGNLVFVKPIPEQADDMFIKIQGEEKPQKGTIISKGELVTDINEGDTVLYKKLAGTSIKIEGEEYLFMRRGDLYATIPAETTIA